MMPAMKLNTPPVTSSHPPHSMVLARGSDPPDGLASAVTFVAPRQPSQAITASPISAAGSSQLTCPPMSAANSLVSPAEPPNRGPAPPPKPTEPVSVPSSLPRRSEEHTSELQSQSNLVCRLL